MPTLPALAQSGRLITASNPRRAKASATARSPGGEAVRLRLGRQGRRIRRGAPVIQHPRDMTDPSRPLGGAEHEVVVLRSVEPLPYAAERFEQAAANDEKMGGIHVRQQQYRRPVRLELRRVAAPVHVDLVVVAVDDVGVGMIRGVDRDFGERVRAQEIVVVEERQKLAARDRRGGIRRRRDSSVAVAMHDMDAIGRPPPSAPGTRRPPGRCWHRPRCTAPSPRRPDRRRCGSPDRGDVAACCRPA